MSAASTIEWTDATWNPVRGCALVSPGCTNCYAMRQAHRASGPGRAYEGLTQISKAGPVWTGKVRTVPELLAQPLHWQRPRRIFVNSMSDLFHEDVPLDFIAEVWAIMALSHQHTFQILTKRAARMLAILAAPMFRERVAEHLLRLNRPLDYNGHWPLKRVWLGVSVEDQRRADERIPLLLQTPAAVRWISAEPLLGSVTLLEHLYRNLQPTPETRTHNGKRQMKMTHNGRRGDLHWVVAGGESGPGARPMHPDWVRSLRDQCAAAGVPFFFKQWGAYAPLFPQYHDEYRLEDNDDGCTGRDFPDEGVLYRTGYFYDGLEHQPHTGVGAYWIARVGKRAAGRQLDGRTHDEYPA